MLRYDARCSLLLSALAFCECFVFYVPPPGRPGGCFRHGCVGCVGCVVILQNTCWVCCVLCGWAGRGISMRDAGGNGRMRAGMVAGGSLFVV